MLRWFSLKLHLACPNPNDIFSRVKRFTSRYIMCCNSSMWSNQAKRQCWVIGVLWSKALTVWQVWLAYLFAHLPERAGRAMKTARRGRAVCFSSSTPWCGCSLTLWQSKRTLGNPRPFSWAQIGRSTSQGWSDTSWKWRTREWQGYRREGCCQAETLGPPTSR